MGLLDKLKSGDSTLGLNGEQPKPNSIAGQNTPAKLLGGSQLDLDGEAPSTTYSNSAPEGRGGTVGGNY